MSQRATLVTGGLGGIGTEICRQLCLAGYRVVSTCHPSEEPRITGWQAELANEGFKVPVVIADLSDFEATRAAVEQAEGEVGPIEVLINVAGITHDVTLKKMEPEHWAKVIDSNLNSVFNTTRNVIGGMLERGFGRVVSISSINGQKGQFGQTNYAASKAGIHGFTMSLALEGARKGVTANTISPGYIETAMTAAMPDEVLQQIVSQVPVGRMGQPADIARVVLFLTADDAGYITGTNIAVNGGQYMT